MQTPRDAGAFTVAPGPSPVEIVPWRHSTGQKAIAAGTFRAGPELQTGIGLAASRSRGVGVFILGVSIGVADVAGAGGTAAVQHSFQGSNKRESTLDTHSTNKAVVVVAVIFTLYVHLVVATSGG